MTNRSNGLVVGIAAVAIVAVLAVILVMNRNGEPPIDTTVDAAVQPQSSQDGAGLDDEDQAETTGAEITDTAAATDEQTSSGSAQDGAAVAESAGEAEDASVDVEEADGEAAESAGPADEEAAGDAAEGDEASAVAVVETTNGESDDLDENAEAATEDAETASARAEERESTADSGDVASAANPFSELTLASGMVDPSITDGETLYIDNCAKCHGLGGYGDGPSIGSLGAITGSFVLTILDDRSDEELFNTITNGKGVEMPPWGLVMTEEQRWALVDYIRTLSVSDQ